MTQQQVMNMSDNNKHRETWLTTGDQTDRNDPFSLFAEWMAEASRSEPNDPNAMSLATVDPDGMPNVRIVLLKGVDAHGFVFYTNFNSQKGQEILASHKAALCFHWKSLEKQVRVRGMVEQVSDEEADAYFNSRARQSRIGAWASQQSQPLESRYALEKAAAAYAAKYAIGTIPRPPHWSGFRIVPTTIEFWRAGAFRLHDRQIFKRATPEADWSSDRYYP